MLIYLLKLRRRVPQIVIQAPNTNDQLRQSGKRQSIAGIDPTLQLTLSQIPNFRRKVGFSESVVWRVDLRAIIAAVQMPLTPARSGPQEKAAMNRGTGIKGLACRRE